MHHATIDSTSVGSVASAAVHPAAAVRHRRRKTPLAVSLLGPALLGHRASADWDGKVRSAHRMGSVLRNEGSAENRRRRQCGHLKKSARETDIKEISVIHRHYGL